MRNFQLLATGVDVIPLAHAIMLNPHLWNADKLRTTHELTPHKQVDDIWLRFQDLEPYKSDEGKIIDEHESIFYPAWNGLPQARPLVFDLLRRVEGTRLGRVLITRLSPGKQIEPHVDGGSHAAYYSRYHIVLRGLPGSLFRCGAEKICMQTGELWWFDNSIEHEVINNSADDRIHLIVDIKQ